MHMLSGMTFSKKYTSSIHPIDVIVHRSEVMTCIGSEPQESDQRVDSNW